jgi:hypothetical protein
LRLVNFFQYLPTTESKPTSFTSVLFGLRGAGAVLLRAFFPNAKLCGIISPSKGEIEPKNKDINVLDLTHLLFFVQKQSILLKETDRNEGLCYIFVHEATLIVISQLVLRTPCDTNSFVEFLLNSFEYSKWYFCFPAN